MFGAVSITAGVIAFIAGSLLWWKKALPKVVALLFLAAGAGIGGAVASWVTRGAVWSTNATGSITARLFGAPVPNLLLFGAMFIFLWDMWLKHRASRATAIAAFVIPSLAKIGSVGALGGLIVTLLGALTGLIATALTSLFG